MWVFGNGLIRKKLKEWGRLGDVIGKIGGNIEYLFILLNVVGGIVF
jgi:hypothetical protein